MSDRKKMGAPIRPPAQKDNIIAELRRKTGLSQAEMAEKFGTTQAAVSRWESGARKLSGPALVLARAWLQKLADGANNAAG